MFSCEATFAGWTKSPEISWRCSAIRVRSMINFPTPILVVRKKKNGGVMKGDLPKPVESYTLPARYPKNGMRSMLILGTKQPAVQYVLR